MEDDMRLPTFRGDGSEDPDNHWFLCEVLWSINNVTDEDVKRAQFSTNLRDCALSWYMKFVQEVAQLKMLNEIKAALISEFNKLKSDSQKNLKITKESRVRRAAEKTQDFDPKKEKKTFEEARKEFGRDQDSSSKEPPEVRECGISLAFDQSASPREGKEVSRLMEFLCTCINLIKDEKSIK
jgi:hypothetical protein